MILLLRLTRKGDYMMKPKVLVIAGPTASGKTKVSIEIAKILGGEIISADSMQIYKHMDIGTAKPTVEEMQGITHHLIDILEPSEKFSVAEYKDRATKCIDEILSRGKVPIMVGGTGLYINSVTEEINYDENAGDPKIRAELEEISRVYGNAPLYEELKEIDIDTYNRLHINDTKRIIRAVEVYRATGITITKHQEMSKEIDKKYDYKIVGLSMDREKLYNRINLRVDCMIEQGLEDEARKVINLINENGKSTSLQAIGYKEFERYFIGEIEKEEAIENIKQESRRYAKRQITWFKRTPGLKWIDMERDIDEVITDIINFYKEEV